MFSFLFRARQCNIFLDKRALRSTLLKGGVVRNRVYNIIFILHFKLLLHVQKISYLFIHLFGLKVLKLLDYKQNEALLVI